MTDEGLKGQGGRRRTFLAGSAVLAAAVANLAPRPATAAVPKAAAGAVSDYRSQKPALQTEALARHAVNARFDDLDAATRQAVKLRVLDLMGCVLAGAKASGNAALAEMVAATGSKPEASIIGFPVKATVSDVAMVNAMLRGSVRQEHYAESAMSSHEMMELVKKTELAALEAGKTGLEIEARMTDGQTLVEQHAAMADRHPFVRPSTHEEIVKKFRQQVEFAGYVSTTQADEIITRVDQLEREPDMAKFVALMTRSSLRRV